MSVGSKLAGDGAARGGHGIGLLFRVGHGREGWGWKYGLNWFSAELERPPGPLGNDAPDFGRLRLIPVVAGYGYTHVMGRTRLSANLLGGYAFTSFRPNHAFAESYRTLRGVDAIDTSSSNTFILRPEVSLWYDVNEKIGFNVGVGYVIARPEVTIISALGRDRERFRADMFTIKAGFVYSVY
jgi:hypothetical protein